MNKKICACALTAIFLFSNFFPAYVFAEEQQQYTISGIVTGKNNDTPVKDVEIRIISGDKEFFDRTDASGYYQVDGINTGEYLEVVASKTGYTVTPGIFKVSSLNSNRTINFTASSGKKSDDSPQAARGSSSGEDVPVLSRPASGVSQTQPEYVSETKPFFASETGSPKSSSGQGQVLQSTSTVSKDAFDVSGKVSYYASGLVGVRVMINNDRRMMTSTDVNGYYSIKNLKSGNDYTITFSRDGYMFNPSEYEIIGGQQDFVINAEASASKYRIHGRVAEGRNGVNDVMIRIVSGVDEFSTRTDSDGSYEVTSLSHGSNYFVSASKEGVMITPPKVIVNKLDNDRVINFSAVVQKFSISGTVKDFDGESVKNAEIEIKTTFDTYKVMTNSKGKYVLEDVPMALTYTLTAEKEGYSSSDPFVLESLDRNREVNFVIKKDKEPRSAAIKESKPATSSKAKKKEREPFEQGLDGKAAQQNIKKTDKDQDSGFTAAKEEAVPVSRSSSRRKSIRGGKSEDKSPEPVFAVAKDDKKEEKKLKAEREERERLERKQKAEQERLERQEAEEAERQRIEQERLERQEAEEAEKQRAEQEKIEKKRIAELEELERKDAEEAERQRAEQERIEKKRIAELEELERKDAEEAERQRAEQERIEKKRIAEQEKLEKKQKAEQEKLEKEQNKEAERLAKAEEQSRETQRPGRTPSMRRKSTTSAAASSEDKPAAKASQSREKTVVAAVSADDRSVKTSQSRERVVKVRGKIESRGEPLADVELSMTDGFTATTDERGRYEFQVPAGKRYILRPEAADFYFEPAEVVYDDLKTNVIQDFIPYITVEGEIFAEGKAIPDVPVIVNGSQAAVTNQFGKYRIEKVEYGQTLTMSVSKNGLKFYPNPIEIRDTVKNQENVNFFVSCSIAGRINMQGSGVGLGNASVEVKGSTNTSVATDFGGNFVILGLAQGGSFEITPKAGGYSFVPPSRTFSDLRESFVGQNFSAVKETYTVRGNVNIGGKAIRNAMVSISKRALKYFTDDEGNFIISNLDYGGPYTLNVVSNEHKFEPIVIDILDKDTMIEFSTDISLGGIVLTGNKPMPGVTVDVNGKKHKTDEDGRYLIKGLKYNGDYLLTLATSMPGVIFSPAQKEYKNVKTSVLNDMFHAVALINGKVTSNGGKPFAGAEIRLSGDPNVYKSDSSGYFLIQNVQLGQDYTLEISSAGYKFDPPSREYKNLNSGKMVENFKAVVDGMSIKGKVSAEGRPLKKVAVVIEGTSKARTLTDDDGLFAFDGLAANKKYELTVLSKMHTFEVPSGIIERLDTDKEINLEPGKVASGKTIGEDPGNKAAPQSKPKTAYFRVNGKVTLNGAPLKDVQITSKSGSEKTNDAGEYVMSVKAGESVELVPSLRGYAFSPEKLVVKEIKAAASNMNFNARSNSHTLEGHVLNKDLKGVKGVLVKDLNSSEDFMTDAKGAYKVSGLFNKTVSLIVPNSEEYDFYPENIEVSPENDITANDIYAYPKKLKKAEAFIYGGVNAAVNTAENDVSVVMISPEGGRVSVVIKDDGGNIIKEFEPNLIQGKVSAIHWDGLKSNGSNAAAGRYSVMLNGAGFKGDILNFRVFE